MTVPKCSVHRAINAKLIVELQHLLIGVMMYKGRFYFHSTLLSISRYRKAGNNLIKVHGYIEPVLIVSAKGLSKTGREIVSIYLSWESFGCSVPKLPF